jgi:hypothetical protein
MKLKNKINYTKKIKIKIKRMRIKIKYKINFIYNWKVKLKKNQFSTGTKKIKEWGSKLT